MPATGSGAMSIGAAADSATDLRAAGLTVLVVSMLALSDAVIKLLTAAYPPGQIQFGRGVLACLLLLAWLRLRHAGPIAWRR